MSGVTPLSPAAQKVQDALESFGLSNPVIELPQSTRTAIEAAQAIGCQVAQIVKSLVFKGQRTGRPILVLASGINRVDETALSALASEPVEKANADYVRQHTGFSIGGVPPLGHIEKMDIFIDEDLLTHEEIWAAAGHPRAVFQITPAELIRITGGRVACIKWAAHSSQA